MGSASSSDDAYSPVEPGVYFTYRRAWPSRLLSREAGLGQVVGVDPDLGVVHVRIFWVDDEDNALKGTDLMAIGLSVPRMSKRLGSRRFRVAWGLRQRPTVGAAEVG